MLPYTCGGLEYGAYTPYLTFYGDYMDLISCLGNGLVMDITNQRHPTVYEGRRQLYVSKDTSMGKRTSKVSPNPLIKTQWPIMLIYTTNNYYSRTKHIYLVASYWRDQLSRPTLRGQNRIPKIVSRCVALIYSYKTILPTSALQRWEPTGLLKINRLLVFHG